MKISVIKAVMPTGTPCHLSPPGRPLAKIRDELLTALCNDTFPCAAGRGLPPGYAIGLYQSLFAALCYELSTYLICRKFLSLPLHNDVGASIDLSDAFELMSLLSQPWWLNTLCFPARIGYCKLSVTQRLDPVP